MEIKELKPHTLIYEPEYAIKNEDGTVFYHRPTIKKRSNGNILIELESHQVGVKQTVQLLRNIIKTLLAL